MIVVVMRACTQVQLMVEEWIVLEDDFGILAVSLINGSRVDIGFGVDDAVFDINIVTDIAVLKYDRIADGDVLTYIDLAEQDTVLHGTINDTATGDKGIDDPRWMIELGRGFINCL